jgi:hypothetical protein
MSPRHRCALLLVILAAGCTRWGPLPGAGLAHPQSEELDRVTVYLRDSTAVELDDAAITPDSIVGLEHGSSTRWAVVRADVARVETQNPDSFVSFASGALAAVVAILALVKTMPST